MYKRQEDLNERVVLKLLSNALMKRIKGNYRSIVGFNAGLIGLGIMGAIPPATSAPVSYTHLLALSKKGGAYLKDLKKSGACELTIITNMSKENLPEEIRYGVSRDILASDIYNLLCERDMYRFSEYVRKPFISGE